MADVTSSVGRETRFVRAMVSVDRESHDYRGHVSYEQFKGTSNQLHDPSIQCLQILYRLPQNTDKTQ